MATPTPDSRQSIGAVGGGQVCRFRLFMCGALLPDIPARWAQRTRDTTRGRAYASMNWQL